MGPGSTFSLETVLAERSLSRGFVWRRSSLWISWAAQADYDRILPVAATWSAGPRRCG